jgi:hypothetical protein
MSTSLSDAMLLTKTFNTEQGIKSEFRKES